MHADDYNGEINNVMMDNRMNGASLEFWRSFFVYRIVFSL